MSDLSASPATGVRQLVQHRRFLKRRHVPTPRIGKLSITGYDFTHCGEAHCSSIAARADAGGCSVHHDQGMQCCAQHCLAACMGLCSARLDCRRCMASPDIATASKGAISCREPGAHGGLAFELLRLLPHTCGSAPPAVSTLYMLVQHCMRVSECRRKAFQLGPRDWVLVCTYTLALDEPDWPGRCTSSTGE
jgi:hypothetical protein